MFRNYFMIAVRNFTRAKTFSFINIFGLAIGFTSCLLIMLYVKQELSYDEFHENADRIYRICVENKYPDRVTLYSQTPLPLAPAFRTDFPQISKIARVYFDGERLIEANDKRIFENRIVFADPEFLDIFSFHIISATSKSPLEQPTAVMLTKSTAKKYFGDSDPLGQTIRYRNKYDLQVTGVLEDVPLTSHFTFDFLISFNAITPDIFGMSLDQWGAYTDVFTYMLLPESMDIAQFEQQTANFITSHYNPRPNRSQKVFFQHLPDIYLQAHNEDELGPRNFVTNLVILALIAGFILLIASINFMNLSTARSVRRAKEVGIRKVLGAVRKQLTRQFLGESILMAVVAMATALMLIELMLPSFSELVGKEIHFLYRDNIDLLFGIAGLTLVVGMVSGVYPALVLSAFRPVAIVKGHGAAEMGSRWPLYLRCGLVVLQFVISIVLIFGTLIARQQLKYMQNADMGFRQQPTILLPLLEDGVEEKYEAMKQDLAACPGVLQAAAGFRSPISNRSFDTSAYPEGYDGNVRFSIIMNFVDFDYFDQYGVPFLAGRNFQKEFTTDLKEAFIVNETLAKKLGFVNPEEAIGFKLPIGINRIQGTIIGVTRDFHFKSLREEIQPMVTMHWPDIFRQISVTVNGQNMPETLKAMEKVWQVYQPSYPFRYEFQDDAIKELYDEEAQGFHIVTTFSAIAILIACLGLFGLSAFTAEQRTKEIGMRKVLGAGVHNIVMLMSRDFLRLVGVAGLVAVPLAYLISNELLQNFAYRIEPGATTALLAIGLALAVALLTVSFQAVKSALSNLVDTLRYE